MQWPSAVRKLFLAPDVVEEALDAAVVEAFGEALARAGRERVVAAGPPLRAGGSGSAR